MTETEPPTQHPTEAESTTPLLAATIVLVRDGAEGLEVLVLQKAAGKHFAGGALVFPGGKSDDADAAYARDFGEADDAHATLKVTAVREMFEETGILLARRPSSENLLGAAEVAALAEADPGRPVLDLARAAGLELATDTLELFAHWITPPPRSKRFDTHFFVAPAPEGQFDVTVDGYEIVASAWRRPQAILDEVHAGRLKLVLPTMMNLIKLAQWETVPALLAHTRLEEVFCVRPERVETPDGQEIVIPEEAGYGVTTIPSRFLRSA
jgi:8-oxo-dGTP pyrophosphatase MutT (NUDIX family)